MKIVIVMPTYNEVKNIGMMIDILAGQKFSELKPAEMQLLIVDSASPDGTADIVRQKMISYPNVYLLEGESRGLGDAYIKGFKYAMLQLHADAVVEMDADFQHDPEYLDSMIATFSNGADYVIGSRYMPGGSLPSGWSRFRRVISSLGNDFARYFLSVTHLHDLTTGYKLTRIKGVMDRIDLDNLMVLHGFAYKVDLLYQIIHLSKTVVEIPIHFRERKHGESKFDIRELIETLRVVVNLRGRAVSERVKNQ